MKLQLLALLAAVVLPGISWAQSTGTVLHDFSGAKDGAFPKAPLLRNEAGALYGTASAGGLLGIGVAFMLTPPAAGASRWTEATLHAFGNPGEGAIPTGGLIADAAGNLYGTNSFGVSSSGGTVFGTGTVFKLTPPPRGHGPWLETTLYAFTGGADGGSPFGELLFDQTGALYGVTTYGGPENAGVVFRLSPPAAGQTAWTESVLTSQTGDGFYPGGGLIQDAAGNLYGVYQAGGLYDGGSVFELSPPPSGQGSWIETVLHSFDKKTKDGYEPGSRLLMDASGAIYGTTVYGGAATRPAGTVFRLAPPLAGHSAWTETVLYNFAGRADGGLPVAGLLAGPAGSLYGTATIGGAFYHGNGQAVTSGVIFKLIPPAPGQTGWTETVLHSFAGKRDGGDPVAPLIADTDGALYTTAVYGGGRPCAIDSGSGCGSVVKLVP